MKPIFTAIIASLLLMKTPQTFALDAEPTAQPSAKEESPIKSSPITGDNIEEAARIGAETAAADIKAGNFRILNYGMRRQSDKDANDEQTGYRIQSVAGCKVLATVRAEADAYNKAMRDWHAKNPTQSKK